jgi:excinuclease UvrABC ATPase subunit
MIVAITGVSGSGKSTLVYDVIYKALEALHKASPLEDNGIARTFPSACPAGAWKGPS